ncbi:MAG: hypothetical protein U9R79_01455 [Armatimonadota bacterium]|nr:hypothetical protein [Armatimonadota bacterium]
MSTVYRDQLDELLDQLPEENIRALLDVLREMGSRARLRRWSSAVGGLSDTDAEEMRRAVEEGCESIDTDSL